MPALAFFQNIGATEVLVIVLLVALLFGAKRIPELFRSMGQGIKEFKRAVEPDKEEKKKKPPEKSADGEDHESDG